MAAINAQSAAAVKFLELKSELIKAGADPKKSAEARMRLAEPIAAGLTANGSPIDAKALSTLPALKFFDYAMSKGKSNFSAQGTEALKRNIVPINQKWEKLFRAGVEDDFFKFSDDLLMALSQDEIDEKHLANMLK